jgi:hypothetical protein
MHGDHGRMDAQQLEPNTAASNFPMSDIEMELADLRATTAILGHIASERVQRTG